MTPVHQRSKCPEDVRPWVKRLGSYLRIFGGRTSLITGERYSSLYLDSLIRRAKEREDSGV